DNVEDRMGHGRYVIFYFLCGLSASIAHIWANPNSNTPSLGASGAIAGVLGAYLLLYPRARVVVLFFVFLIEVPAILFLGLWFVQQYFNGMLSLGVKSVVTGGVAWWAHIGGFAAGALLVGLFAQKRYRPVARHVWWSQAR
ncbi:MAG: rhomboid family intramembrane serine protease, partial [Acidobacteria bacterium]|nr:rhomboid family intramembrane serine protease [Acidobacteriota bacterium]